MGAFALFGRAAPEAANRVIDLEAFAGPDAAELRTRLLALASPAERFTLLEQFLGTRASRGTPASAFVKAAVERIEQAHGNVRVSLLHEESGVSRKHLAVMFTREVGVAPKTYAQLRRFVWTLARLRESESIDWAQLAARAGYADQSHLVRDFRRVADASPTEFLRKRSPDTAALLEEPR